METVNVYYVRDFNGDVTAIFPDMIEKFELNPGERLVTCYAHVGQHGVASLGYVNEREAASETEYADLHAELSQIYETGDDAVHLEIINAAGFHFSNGASLSLVPNEIGNTWAYPFSADIEADPDMLECFRRVAGAIADRQDDNVAYRP